MKKTIFTIFVAAITSLFAFTSCQKEPTDLIVGKWALETLSITSEGITTTVGSEIMGGDFFFTFAASGTFTMTVAPADGEASESVTGSYNVAGEENLTLYLTTEGETVAANVSTLNEDTLVMSFSEMEDGEEMAITITFKRA